MNVSDSEHLGSGFEQLGLQQVDQPDEADFVVLNTCVVRQAAEDTATGMLGRLGKHKRVANPAQFIAVMGCMVGPQQNDLRRRFPHVDAWARPQEFDAILEKVALRCGVDPEGCISSLVPLAPGVSAFVPIVHGCDKFCTFCIIPYRRGREASRPPDELLHEVSMLAARGVKDVTLLGQNVDSFGHDLRPRWDLADLLEAVHDVEGIERVRFLTSHPNDMSERIIRAVAALPKVCENVNLPFQAGDDRVLAEMRRGYSRSQYLEKATQVREMIPGVTLTTDLIVGFPGETTDEFERSLDMLDSVRFDKVHAAAYSERPGTLASRILPDSVSRQEKKRRLAAAAQLQESIQTELNAELIGTICDILVDGESRGRMHGRTRGDKLVYLNGERQRVGEMVGVQITGSSPWSLEGNPVPVVTEKVKAAVR